MDTILRGICVFMLHKACLVHLATQGKMAKLPLCNTKCQFCVAEKGPFVLQQEKKRNFRNTKDENGWFAEKRNFFHSQHKRATQNQIFANTVQISATQQCKFPQHKSSSPVSYRRPLRFPVERRETRANLKRQEKNHKKATSALTKLCCACICSKICRLLWVFKHVF